MEEKSRIWLYHKPKGIMTTHNDPEGRPTVFEMLKNRGLQKHIMSVGRLDFQSEGLLIVTNDGHLSRTLEMPSSGI